MHLAVVLCLVASAVAHPASESPTKGIIDYEVPVPLGYPAPVLRSNIILNDHVIAAPYVTPYAAPYAGPLLPSLGAPVVVMEKKGDEADKHEGSEKPKDGEHKPLLVRLEDPRTPIVRSGLSSILQGIPWPIKFPEIKWPWQSLPWPLSSGSGRVYTYAI